MTQITPRLSVSGPDHDGDYELMLNGSVLVDCTHLSRASADALIAALRPVDVAPEQSEQSDLVAAITNAVRDADRDFERVGGSSRHWVRECFLPTLNAAGLIVTRLSDADVLCRHCNEELRYMDGAWRDRETHRACLHSEQRHEPAPPSIDPATGAR